MYAQRTAYRGCFYVAAMLGVILPAVSRAGVIPTCVSGQGRSTSEGMPSSCMTGSSPTVQVSPAQGYGGQSVAVSGQGVPGAPDVRVVWITGQATATAAVVTVDPTGDYSTAITVPEDIDTRPVAQLGNYDELWDSDATGGPSGPVQFIANDFTVFGPTRVTVTGLRWWGGYSYDPGVPSSDDFTLEIFADDNGLPGASLHLENVGNNVSRTATGRTISAGAGDAEEFAYRATLSVPFDAQPGVTYWLGISGDTSGHPSVWGWEESHEGNDLLAYSQNGGPWASAQQETAFELLAEATPVQVCAAATGTADAVFTCATFTIEAPPPGTVQGTIPVGTGRGAFNAEINLYDVAGRRAGSAPISPDGSFVASGIPAGFYNAGVTGNVPSLVEGAAVNVEPGGVSIADLQVLDIPTCNYGAYVPAVPPGAVGATPNHETVHGGPPDYLGTYLSLGAAGSPVVVTFTADVQTAVGVSLERVEFQIQKSDGVVMGIGSDSTAPYTASYNVSLLPPDDESTGDADDLNFLIILPVTDEGPTPACRYAYMRIKVIEDPTTHPLIRNGTTNWNGARRRYEFSGEIPELALLPATWPDPPPDIPLLGEIENTLDAYLYFAGNLELDGDLRFSALRARAEGVLFGQDVFDPVDQSILPDGAEDLVFDITDIRNTRYPFGPDRLVSFGERLSVFRGPLASFWGIITVMASVSLGIDGGLELEGELRPLLPAVDATLTANVEPSLSLSVWVDLLAVVSAGADATARLLFGLPLRVNTLHDPPVWFASPCLGIKVVLDAWARVNLWFWSHRWDLASWTLFCEEDGGCGFCGGRGGLPTSAPPDVMSSPSVASGPGGSMLAVYTENTAPGMEFPTVQVMCRFWDPTLNEWGPATAITDGSRFVQDPVAAFVGPDGHAIVAYTENTMTLAEQQAVGNDLVANLMRQEIFVAYWDGLTWSISQLTDDVQAEGRAALAGDAAGATLAWTRDDGDGDITTRNDLRIAVRNYDYSTSSWDAMQTLTALQSDSQVSVARSGGYAVLAWSSEGDSDPNTNADRFLALAEGIAGGGWTQTVPSALPAGAELPSVAINPIDSSVELAMTVRGKDGDGISDTGVLNDQAALAFASRDGGGVWTAAAVTDDGLPIRAERPRLVVGQDGESLLLFRRFGTGGTNAAIGQLALMQKAPGGTAFSNPLYVTNESRQHWQQALAVNSFGQAAVCNVSRAPIDVTGAAAPASAVPAKVFEVVEMAGGNDPVECFVIDAGSDPALDPQMTASEQHAAPGSSVQVTATLRNLGRTSASNLTVSFYAGTPGSGTFLGDVAVAGPLGFNQSLPVAFQTTRTGGGQLITAEVTAGGDIEAGNNQAAIDLGALPAPRLVTATESQLYAGALKIRWLPPGVYGVAGYRILRSDVPGGAYELVGESTRPIYHDLMLEVGTTYYYVVQAYDADCVLSAYSLEAAGTPAVPGCPQTCGDIDGSSGAVDLNDFATFAVCYGLSGPAPGCSQTAFDCSDLDASGSVDLNDFATLALWYGLSATQSPPDCGW